MNSSRSMGSLGAWVFGILTVAGAGLFLYSWLQPWWQAYIVALNEIAVVIRPWGLVSYMPQEYSKWLVGAEMPEWFAPVMWLYLAASMGVLVYSLFAGDDWFRVGRFKLTVQKALVGAVGLSYIIFVVVCVIVIAIRASGFYGATVMGSVFVSMSDHEMSNVDTGFLTGYWLAAAVGPLLLALAFLRDKIRGKRQATA
ncbi:MAG: hypothetical protein HY782_19180 [Chloroflexi bacterium]|nr:hypothetical protein [Chloroflexota bacterium]